MLAWDLLLPSTNSLASRALLAYLQGSMSLVQAVQELVVKRVYHPGQVSSKKGSLAVIWRTLSRAARKWSWQATDYGK